MTQNKTTRRKQFRSVAFIALSFCLIIPVTLSLINLTHSQHSEHEDLYSKIDDYNSQLVQIGKKINWDDAKSIKSGFLDLQKVLLAKAPYLDSLTNLLNQSLASIASENTQRSPDTLRFISWHKIYLQNLSCQKKAQLLTDSLCYLLTQVPFHKPEFNQQFAVLLANDSAITATHIIEDSLRQTLGGTWLPH